MNLSQGISASRSSAKYPGLELVFLAFCLASPTACHRQPTADRASPSRLTCPRPVEIPREIASAGSTTVFGEIHGTREAPEFFGDVVCNAARGPQRIVVGLEFPSSEASALNAFLAGNDVLSGRKFWTQPFQSGRTSAAMRELLSELRRIVKNNSRVEVFLFDISDGANPQDRDASMADTILKRRAADRDALVLVFTGNLHARKAKGVPWDPTLEPMAYHLVASGLKITSLNMRNPKGTAWICRSNEASSCGPVDIGGEEASSGALRRGIRLTGTTSADGYDGVYIVSSVTASPPVMSVRR